ncbi:MAG: hypothetical protein J6U23_14760 [Clostridiales bacterium]|nr:hypothetical protein [Clostridiales bacterium]
MSFEFDNMMRRKEEYGGFLPLELNSGKEYFSEYESLLSRFNSVKAGLEFIIKETKASKLFLPCYYCPSTTEAILRTGIDVVFYHIDEEMKPKDIPDEAGSLVVLVDYFGVLGKCIEDIAIGFSFAQVILDRAHAFFAKPVLKDNIYNIYSAKKFFGVPDGAYLISSRIRSDEAPSYSNSYASYLLKTYEEGTNSAYVEKKEVDKYLDSSYKGMSKLSIAILENVDYDSVYDRRKENFAFLKKSFDDVNELDISDHYPAYMFPLLLKKGGNDLKKKLVEEKIYVPTLWSGKYVSENGNEFELNMRDNAVFLPIDQRYDTEDMKYIAYITRKMMEG